MPDFADIAEQLSSEQLQQSLASRSQFTQVSYFECEDCGDDIPEQRRKLGGVTLCVSCQSVLEAKRKNFGSKS